MRRFAAILIFLLVTSIGELSALIPTTVGVVGGRSVMMRDGEPTLFVGIQYWGLDDWNVENWDRDIKEFKALGLNGVRLNIAWDHIEQRDGRYNFDLLDQLLDKLHGADLMVYLQFNQSAHEWMPKWFAPQAKESQIYALDDKGNKQYSRISFSSQLFRERYGAYVLETIDHIKDHDALVAYSIYTEPHFAEREQMMDYNLENIKSFRKWLTTQYPSIEALNSAWGKDYKNFSKVAPPRIKGEREEWDVMTSAQRSCFAMWRIWNCVAKAEFIGSIVEQARKVDPNHLYGQNMMWKWSDKYFNYVSLDPQINYEYADIVGINIYPMEDNSVRVGDSSRFIGSLHESKKIVWLGEFNSKHGYVESATLKKFVSEAIDGGCTGYVYFTYSGNAAGGIERYSVMLDGARQDSWHALSHFNASVTGRKGLQETIFTKELREADCYMLWSFVNRFCYLSNSDYMISQYWNTRLLLRQEGLDVDALSESALLAGRFDRSKPIIAPTTPILDEKVLLALKSFVEEGGRLLIVGEFGDYLWCNGAIESYGSAVAELQGCGAQYVSRNILSNENDKIRSSKMLLSTFVKGGK